MSCLPRLAGSSLPVRCDVSLHGVGLSIGGEDPPDPDHLDRLAKLIEFLSEVVVRTGCGDRLGPTPTLIEWDNDVPDFSTLIAESRRAQCILSDRVDLRQCDTYEACA